MQDTPVIEELRVSAFRIPTDAPESDGTYEWNSTTLVIVEATAAGQPSLGYTYANRATASLITDHLRDVVVGRDAMSINAAWIGMVQAIRNLGRSGICSMAISAVDNALWDLKARLLDLPLVKLLGAARDALPIYGSGGFTSYSDERLKEQLGGWVKEGIPRVKMKIGREPDRDVERVSSARQAIGDDAKLFVDANGAYSRKQALELAYAFSDFDVSWFEEPVSSDDLEGLRLIRDDGPPGMEIAAGEYGYDETYFRRMLDAGAVDVLQADATRCAGITGFLMADALCQAAHIPLSAHCGPSMHVHVGCAAKTMRHAEYFHDHVRIENKLFEGVIQPADGALKPDLSRPGHGLEFKHADAEKFKIYEK
ncbi:MAG: mandelate racemase [Verrucomicrobiota bacterium]|nr:mandelate racemase [Verrucomicrobiota bacterium]